MVATLLTVLGVAALVLGTTFCVFGVYALLRFPDTYTRLHGIGLTLTLGAGGVLASLIFLGTTQAALKGVATAAFLLFTAPAVTHALARSSYRDHVPLGPAAVRDDLAEEGRARTVPHVHVSHAHRLGGERE